MFDVERLLGKMLSGGSLGKMASGISQGMGGVNGGIGGGLSKGALGVGALGVAWAAFEHFSEKNKQAADQATPPPPPGAGVAMPPPPPPIAAVQMPVTPVMSVMPVTPVTPNMPVTATAPALANAVLASQVIAVTSDHREADASHLIKAMIAAANADGVFDAEERASVLQRTLSVGLSPATQQFLLTAMNQPLGVAELCAHTRPELRRETYAASVLAINVDTEVERNYLQALANGLGLSPDDCAQIQQQVLQ